MPWDQATRVWDALVAAGARFDLRPAGMLALDVARIEAGLLLIEVDFFSSRKALIPASSIRRSRWDWAGSFSSTKARLSGSRRCEKNTRDGAARQIVGLTINWEEVEALYEKLQLPPQVPATASRVAVPVYRDGVQVGKATSTTWSPVLKKMIALATVERGSAEVGSRVEMEVTVEAVRHRVGATVTPTPFFNPARKTARLA